MQVVELRHGSAEYQAVVEFRRRLLRLPLGLDFSEDELAAEKREVHLALFDGAEVVACAVLVPGEEGVVKMRQVAVAPERRGQGLGRKIVERAEQVARERGFRRMVLNARDSAVPFYERVGYEAFGEPFVEVTLPHRSMAKALC